MSALACTLLVLLGFSCWYMGPNKHATMLQYGQYKSISDKHQDILPKTSLGNCEKCHKYLRTVHGKFGDFIACSGYPACKYIKRARASFVCPECKGSIEKRVWSGGILWGCSNYPDCRYAIFSDIQDAPCTVCKASPYQLKTVGLQGESRLKCPNHMCGKSVDV